jgi:hypothetical protein
MKKTNWDNDYEDVPKKSKIKNKIIKPKQDLNKGRNKFFKFDE